MLDGPGAFREKIHRVISQEISGPVFGQSTLFLFSSPHDSNKGKDIGCLRGVGDGHFNARSDRKSTRLNSSHGYISYAVFCLKKKKKNTKYQKKTYPNF